MIPVTYSKSTLILLICLITGSCQTSKIRMKSGPAVFSFQAGTNKGGIVENTDMGVIDGATIDAFTGATRRGFNAGARISFPFRVISLETGLDYMLNNQTFSYNDPVNQYAGQRKLLSNQFILPTTINFMFFRKRQYDGMLQVKAGHLMQYNFISSTSEQGVLPPFSISNWSNGFTGGATLTPFVLRNGDRIGIFIEFYRGSSIYRDYYNPDDVALSGSSFSKFGLIYKLK
jgi:hypothetical protein